MQDRQDHPAHPHDDHGGEHPRLVQLRSQVLGLPVNEQYRAQLLQSIDTYREQILERPHYTPDEGWDDLKALQQVTLGDMMARLRQRKADGCREPPS